MAASAVLSNFLWVPKSAVTDPPERFAPEWFHQIELLKTPQGKIAQQQISFLREQAEIEGDDPNSVIKELTQDDKLEIRNWASVGDWWALCSGDLGKVKNLVERLKLPLKDKRVEVPWEPEVQQRLKLLMTPRDYQPKPFLKWYKAGYGIFQANPAFGKTFVMCWSIIDRKQYTLILVPTDQLADQFITRFRDGSPRGEEVDLVTNCAEVEKEIGRPIVGRYRSPKDIFPVTVATWQSFTSPAGRRALKALNKRFGYVMADEAHTFAAPSPSSVVNGFHAKYKQGVTATPKRKDQLEVGLYDVLGPVTAIGTAPQLPVTAYITATGCKYPARRGLARRNEWTMIINWLLKQEDRNDLIVDWLHTDVGLGRNILVLADRVQWCLDMANRLNKEEGIAARAVIGGMNSTKGIAERARVIQAMLDGDIRVIFATQVFKAGVDIANLDTLYAVCPSNNAPQLQQMLGRIRRKYEGKQDPVFRYFVDEGHGLLYGCARGTHRALVAENCAVIPVQAGRKPSAVMKGGVFDAEEKPKTGLRAIANRQSTAMSGLFTDLNEEAALKKRYDRRLGKRHHDQEEEDQDR